ncbi:HECT-domain (ubiquitin-transferase) domain-containing protein [Besnoitia besnoiti]|uniref:HECT-type E3 ubiquitin transferase n=1 Tax=Besnoitia besnoiti TaxID=94643 RepID=A0A2A9LZE3_BESBE|nr:HECT-domain (ubiquitin-transferase) domain-containing protein [Besnoitia besnoiti]PFH31145.1 HECT-domain (ubiquitin-transferase) domain-containing protein [Besnoitia besnoiti]
MFADFRHNSHRTIDLSGSSRPSFVRGRQSGLSTGAGAVSRSSLLEFQRRERQLREQHRKSVDASSKIQKCWKAAFARRRAKAESRRAFDATVAALYRGEAAGSDAQTAEESSAASGQTGGREARRAGPGGCPRCRAEIRRALPVLIRNLAFFFDPEDDGSRKISQACLRGAEEKEASAGACGSDADQGRPETAVVRTREETRAHAPVHGGEEGADLAEGTLFHFRGAPGCADDVSRLGLVCEWLRELGKHHESGGGSCGEGKERWGHDPTALAKNGSLAATEVEPSCLFCLAVSQPSRRENGVSSAPAPLALSTPCAAVALPPADAPAGRPSDPPGPSSWGLQGGAPPCVRVSPRLTALTLLRLVLQCVALRYRATLFESAPASLLPPLRFRGGSDAPARIGSSSGAFAWTQLRPALGWRGSVLSSSLSALARAQAAPAGSERQAAEGERAEPARFTALGSEAPKQPEGDRSPFSRAGELAQGGLRQAEGLSEARGGDAGARGAPALTPAPFLLLPPERSLAERQYLQSEREVNSHEAGLWVQIARDVLLALSAAPLAAGASLAGGASAGDADAARTDASDAAGSEPEAVASRSCAPARACHGEEALADLVKNWRRAGRHGMMALLADALVGALLASGIASAGEEGSARQQFEAVERAERQTARVVETCLRACDPNDVGGEVEFLVHLLGAPCLLPVPSGAGAAEAGPWRRRVGLLSRLVEGRLASVPGTSALQANLVAMQVQGVAAKLRKAEGAEGAKFPARLLVATGARALLASPQAAPPQEAVRLRNGPQRREAETQLRELMTKEVFPRDAAGLNPGARAGGGSESRVDAQDGRQSDLQHAETKAPHGGSPPLALWLVGNALALLYGQLRAAELDQDASAPRGVEKPVAAQRALLCLLCWGGSFVHDALLRQSVLSSEEQHAASLSASGRELRAQLRLLMAAGVLRALFACADQDPSNRFPPLLRLFFPPSLCAESRPAEDTEADRVDGEAADLSESDEDLSDGAEAVMADVDAQGAEAPTSAPSLGMDRLILNALAMNTSLSAHLLPVIRLVLDEECRGDVDEFLRQLGPAPLFDSPLGQVLRAACTLLQYQLELMYDSELVDSARMSSLSGFFPAPDPAASSASSASLFCSSSSAPLLTVPDIQWLSLTLNKVAWKLLQACYAPPPAVSLSALRSPPATASAWARLSPGALAILGGGTAGASRRVPAAGRGSALRPVLTTLVRQLFDRNSRLHFLPETSWILPETMSLLKSKALLHQQERLAQLDAPFLAAAAATEGLERVANSGVKHAEKILGALLTELPHTLTFEDRVLVFYDKINADRLQYRDVAHQLPFDPSLHTIRRDYIVEDGLFALGYADVHDLKGFFRIQFITDEGVPEEGIDGGGLFKEFLVLLSRKVFDPNYGLFKSSSDNSLYPNPSARLVHQNPSMLYTALGKVVGKALYEKILIEPQLNRVFLNLLLGRPNQVDDVQALDPVVHRNLLFLKHYSDNVQNLALTFSVTLGDFGSNEEEDLIPNGRNISVTNDSKLRYIQAVAHYKCTKQIAKQTQAFLHGLAQVIPLKWLQMFSPAELQLLISGSPRGFDVADLREYAQFTGGFEASSPTIRWLWEILEDMTSEERSKFLMFVTSCSRPPLLGFRNLHPSFTVHRVPETHRLPTTSTCVNLLKLPPYESKKVLRERLLEAVEGTQGFGLS